MLGFLLLLLSRMTRTESKEESCHASHRFYIYEKAACFVNLSILMNHSFHPFPLEYVINSRLLDHPCRTHDSETAAAVFVPTYGGTLDALFHKAHKQAQDDTELVSCLAHIHTSLRTDRRWLRHKGADFHYAYSRTGTCCAGVRNAIKETALSSGWAFSIEPDYVQDVGWAKQMGNSYELHPWPHPDSLHFQKQCFPLVAGRHSIGVPYPLPHVGNHLSLVVLREQATASERRVLMAAQFGLHGRGAGVRHALMRQCMALAATQCSTLQLHNGSEHVPAFLAVAPDLSNSLLLEAKYALQPAGDSPTRSMLWKALRAGAVPVLFQSCAEGFWMNAYAGFLDSIVGFGVHSWAVALNSTEVMRNDTYVLDELAAIPDSTRRAMSAEGLAIAPRNTYLERYDPTMRDAIDVIVDKMTAQMHQQKI